MSELGPDSGCEGRTVRLSPDKCFGDLQRSLQRALDLAALALRSSYPPEAGRPSLDVFPTWQVGNQLAENEVRGAFVPWIKGHALSDMIEALEPLLDGIYAGAVLAECPRTFSSQGELEDFMRRLETPPAAGKPLGRKIEALHRDYPQLLPAELADAADPLRRLRNCLTHASGVVRSCDCDKSGSLRIDGFLWEAVFVSDSGETSALTPGFISPGGHVGLRKRAVPLSWRVGERVSVSEGDLLAIAGTLLFFAAALRRKLFGLLKEAGRVPESFAFKELTLNFQATFVQPEAVEVTAVLGVD